MKRLILSNVNSQEVRKKSDVVIVPPEYIAKFDGIFAKYKHFSFIPLLNEAIRAKDLSPQCVTLKKILKAKELVEGMEDPQLLQVSVEVTQWIAEVLFNIDSRNTHRDLLSIIGRFLECAAIKEVVYKTFTASSLECLKDRDEHFLLRLYGLTALLAYQPLWVFFKDNTLFVMQYFTKHLAILTDIMQRGEIINYNDIVNKVEVLLNTYLSYATKFPVAEELRQELATFAQQQNKTVFELLTTTTLTSLPKYEEAPYCVIAHKALNHLASIMRSPICSTDANYSAGLLVSLFVKNITTGSTDDKEQIRSQIVQAILYTYANPDIANATSVLQFFVTQDCWIYGKEFSSFTNVGQLAVLKGALIALGGDFDILFAPTKALKKSEVSSAEDAILLLDGLFMMTCSFCETSSERYNRFIAFQALDSCLDQTKRFVQQGGKVSPLHVKAMINAVLDLIWKNWEDPFESIVSQIRNIFVSLLEVYDGCVTAFGSMDEQLGKDFILNLTKQLVYLDWHCKGKYPILLILLSRVGSEAVLKLRGDFVAHLLLAMSNNTVSKQAAGVLETFLNLVQDAANAELKTGQRFKTTEEAAAHCRSYWIAPLIDALFDPLTYGGTSTYTIPVVLKQQPESLPFILDAICLAGSTGTETGPLTLNLAQYRAVVGVLKIARRMELFEPQQLTSMKGMKSSLSMTDLIESALIHQDRDIRLDVLELLCITRRKSEQISEFELKSLLTFITYNLLDSSSPFRRKVFLLVEKMLVRLRDAAQKMYQTAVRQKQDTVPADVAMSVHYTNWISTLLNFNLYPGSCYPRLTASLELIQFLTSTFHSDNLNALTFIKNSGIPLEIYTSNNAAEMLNAVRDHYDDDRRMSDDILKRFPKPLPGFTAENLKTLIKSALDWVGNPRMHECDTACITLNTVVSKFIRAGWKIRLQADGEILIDEHDAQPDRSLAVLDFLNDLIALVDKHVAIAKESIAKASAVAPMHGPLMAIRFILSEVDFNDKEVATNGDKWRVFLADFIQRLYTVRDVAFTVGHPVRYRLDLVNEDDESLRLNAQLEDDGDNDNDGDEEDGELDFVEFSHGQGQAIVVCAWLCLKEVSLGLATVVKKTPLSDSRTMLVSEQQIHSIGNLMLDSLLQIRHKGAIEKLSVGLQAVCEILFTCTNPQVNVLPIGWLNDLISRVLYHSKKLLSQRRSAGLPYAYLSILRAEVLCKRRAEAQGVVVSSDLLHDTYRTMLDVTNNKMPHLQALVDKGEFFHQVHALNIIRSVLRDSQVNFESGPLVEATLVTVLDLYGSVRWPVQNAATATFATILGRYVAWRQARRSEEASVVKSSVNGMTPAEFFARFPRMHKLLKEKIDSILSGGANQPNLGSKASRQTSLYAILVLLSRLLPSRMESPKDQHVEQAFLPVVRQCCTSSDMMVRTMAARALVPLVSSRDFHSFITDQLINAIPNQDSTAPLNHNSLHGILLQIQILLRGHEPLMFFAEAKTDLYEDILPRLLPKLWLISDARSAPAVGSVLLDIIAEFVLGVNQPHKQPFLQQTREKCAAFKQLSEQGIALARLVLSRPVTGLSVQHMILDYNARRLAASILIHDAFELKSGRATELVLELMVDPTYEVRLLAVNHVNEHLRKWKSSTKGSLQIDVNPIQALVLSRLGMVADAKIEDHNETIVQLLKIMSDVDLDLPQQLFSSFFEENTVASNDLWGKLWTFYNSKSSLVKEEGFRAMGFYIKQLCQHLHTSGREPIKAKLALALSQWIELTNKHSDVDQPLEMRTIVADSLISAGLSHKTLALVPAGVRDVLEKATVEAWMVVVKLLQDDEDDLRDSVAKFAATLAYEGSKLPLHNSVIVSRAIQLAFDYLTQHFASSEHYFEYLVKLVVQSEDIATSMNRDHVEDDVLFETEEDNIFFENVSLIQFATYHINEILAADSSLLAKRKARLAELLPSAVSYLNAAIQWMKHAQVQHDKQVMWLLYDEFKFLCFYRVFMTALIVFRAHQGSLSQLSAFDAFKASVTEFNTLHHIHPVLTYVLDHVTGLTDPSARVVRGHDPYISLYFSTGLNLHSTQWQLTKH